MRTQPIFISYLFFHIASSMATNSSSRPLTSTKKWVRLSSEMISKLYTPYDSCVLLKGFANCNNVSGDPCDIFPGRFHTIPQSLYYSPVNLAYHSLIQPIRKLSNTNITILMLGDSIMRSSFDGLLCLLRREDSRIRLGTMNSNYTKHVLTTPIVLDSPDHFTLPIHGYTTWQKLNLKLETIPLLEPPRRYLVVMNSGLHEKDSYAQRLKRFFDFWTNRADVSAVVYRETSLQHYASEPHTGVRRYCGYFPDITPYKMYTYPYFRCIPHNESDCPPHMDYRQNSEREAIEYARIQYQSGQHRLPIQLASYRSFSGYYYDMHPKSSTFTPKKNSSDCTHMISQIPVLNYLHWAQIFNNFTLQ
jgi:hypothetical protein